MRVEGMMEDAALAEVIRGAQRGDPAAFDRLVESFASRISGFLFRMTGSRQDSEDLAQEVFLRLVRMIGAYQHDGRFEAWLFRIAANLARDRVRRAKRSPTVFGDDESGASGVGTDRGGRLDNTAGAAESADARMILDEEIERLNSALQMLPTAEREVIALRHFSQLSFKEIAEMTGTPLGTALARAHRGLAKLRDIMDGPGASSSADGARIATAGG